MVSVVFTASRNSRRPARTISSGRWRQHQDDRWIDSLTDGLMARRFRRFAIHPRSCRVRSWCEFDQDSRTIFDVPVTVTLQYADGRLQDVVVPVSDAHVEQRIPTSGTVREVQINRDSAALARLQRASASRGKIDRADSSLPVTERFQDNDEPLPVLRIEPGDAFARCRAFDGGRRHLRIGAETRGHHGGCVADTQLGTISQQNNGNGNGAGRDRCGGSGSASSWAITGATRGHVLMSRISIEPTAISARRQARATSHSTSELTRARVASIGLESAM